PTTFSERLRAQAIGIATLTLPVVLYFTVLEWSRWKGTVGKHVLGLRVVSEDGQRLTFGRSLWRSIVKFVPWEIAHTALWHMPGGFVAPAPTPVTWLLLATSQLGASAYVAMLFVGTRRPLYDRLA